jgi:hypothetical protein
MPSGDGNTGAIPLARRVSSRAASRTHPSTDTIATTPLASTVAQRPSSSGYAPADAQAAARQMPICGTNPNVSESATGPEVRRR